jgi:hypothetical protein
MDRLAKQQTQGSPDAPFGVLSPRRRIGARGHNASIAKSNAPDLSLAMEIARCAFMPTIGARSAQLAGETGRGGTPVRDYSSKPAT